MAIFSNQATLTYRGNVTNSNIAYGEILDVIVTDKTSIEGVYTPGEIVTYVLTLRNTGNAALVGLVVTDDLGGYNFGATTLYPLTYVDGSVTLFVNGVLQPTPAVVGGPPLVISGINIPAMGDAVLVYQARANEFANPNLGGVIINTATVTGDGLNTPSVATEEVEVTEAPNLTVSKCINPSQVVDNDRVTYTLLIQNLGNQAVVATDNASISDVFDPVISALAVTFDGVAWTQGIEYTYDGVTGLFTTVPGMITVPAATFVQDPVTGVYSYTPGVATLVITGTI